MTDKRDGVVGTGALRRPLEAAEEEQLVLLDRTADRSAELVAFVSAHSGTEVLPRAAKGVIADIFKQEAMKQMLP